MRRPDEVIVDGTDRAERDLGHRCDEVESGPGVWASTLSWPATVQLENRFRHHPAGRICRPGWAEIWVKEGIYSLASEIAITKPVARYGGFAGNERSREKRDWKKRPTLLDAPDIGRCLSLGADGIRISGFVFSFGNTPNGGAVMALPLSRFIIEDCLFEGNSANLGGGLCSRIRRHRQQMRIYREHGQSEGGGCLRGIFRFEHHQLYFLREHCGYQRQQCHRRRCGIHLGRRRHHRQLHLLQQQHPL
jgi:hypothetical protein